MIHEALYADNAEKTHRTAPSSQDAPHYLLPGGCGGAVVVRVHDQAREGQRGREQRQPEPQPHRGAGGGQVGTLGTFPGGDKLRNSELKRRSAAAAGAAAATNLASPGTGLFVSASWHSSVPHSPTHSPTQSLTVPQQSQNSGIQASQNTAAQMTLATFAASTQLRPAWSVRRRRRRARVRMVGGGGGWKRARAHSSCHGPGHPLFPLQPQ